MNHDERHLVTQAIHEAMAARDQAYAPYSGFAMGAAVVGEGGVVVRGVLVENVSLGLSMCAERVALFGAVSIGIRPIVLAVCARRTGGGLTFPCGACLQVGVEVVGGDLLVAAVDPDGEHEVVPLSSLLPRAPKRHTPPSAS